MSGWAQLVLAPEVVVAAALLAGLAAAYGRELHEGRRPGRRWWRSTLLLLPAVGVAASAAGEAVPLSGKPGALLTVLLVLSGYDGLRQIEQRWLGPLLRRREPHARRGRPAR